MPHFFTLLRGRLTDRTRPHPARAGREIRREHGLPLWKGRQGFAAATARGPAPKSPGSVPGSKQITPPRWRLPQGKMRAS
jgi:hypothetical protein